VPRLTRPALLLGATGLFMVAFLLVRPASRADVEVTVEPAMVRGAATARVTIIEFSDYQ
jgi:hypothetical protein